MFRSFKCLLILGGLLANVGCTHVVSVEFRSELNTNNTFVWLEIQDADGNVQVVNDGGLTDVAWLGSSSLTVDLVVKTHGAGHMSAGKVGARHGMGEKTKELFRIKGFELDDNTVNDTDPETAYFCVYNFQTKTATCNLVNTGPGVNGSSEKHVSATKQSVSQGLQLFLDFVTANISTEEDIEPFFNELDTDGDGSLSIQEVKAANKANNLGIKAKNVKKGIAYVDDTYGDGNGGLELQELIDAYVDIIVLGGGG